MPISVLSYRNPAFFGSPIVCRLDADEGPPAAVPRSLGRDC
jgi:hypothetical protein